MLLAFSIYITQGINALAVLFGLIYLFQRIARLRRLSDSNRSIHMHQRYPIIRWGFVILFLAINLAQWVLFFIYSLHSEHKLDELLLCIGTFLNGLVLIGGLLLLKLQISKDRKRTHLHMVYSVFLILITTARLTEEIQIYRTYEPKTFKAQIITDSILLSLVLAMFIYKLINRKYEDYLGEEVGIGELEERLRKGSVTVFEEEEEDNDSFPYLKVDVVSVTLKEISFAVFLRQKPFGIRTVSIEQLHNFHIKAQILDLQNRLNIQKQLNVDNIENFVDELLSSWQNYQGFVLQFFGIPSHMHHDWSRQVSKFKQQASRQQQFDPNSIYFSLNLTRLIKYQNSFQALIEVSTRSGKYKKEIDKTLKEIKELHNRLSSLEIKTRKFTFKLILPMLPQSTYVIEDQQTIEERRKQYEKYLQKIVNDRNIVKRHKQARDIVYQFLGYPQAIQMSLRKESTIDYKGLRSKKIRFATKLNQKNQPTIFYYFEIQQHDSHFKRIRKSYRDFRDLDYEVRRYLHNSQTERFVQIPKLPERPHHILAEAEKQQLHTSLNNYLNAFLSTFPDISEIYQFKVFLNIKAQEEESQGSFYEPRESVKKISEYSLDKSNSVIADEILEEQIDNLGGGDFDMQIR